MAETDIAERQGTPEAHGWRATVEGGHLPASPAHAPRRRTMSDAVLRAAGRLRSGFWGRETERLAAAFAEEDDRTGKAAAAAPAEDSLTRPPAAYVN